MTSHVQPLDQGIIKSFSVHYRRLFILYVLDRYVAGESEYYAINQLQAMQLGDLAWKTVASTTIANCWRHAGILSRRDQNGRPIGGSSTPATGDLAGQELSHAMAGLKEHNDALVSRNVIRACDQMSNTNLLNPLDEEISGTCEFTDNEIVSEVLEDEQHNPEDDVEEPVQINSDSEALRLMGHLQEYVLHRHSSTSFTELFNTIGATLKDVNREIESSKVQTTLDSFFGK